MPVAIFSTPVFDATKVEPTSVTLVGAPAGLNGKGRQKSLTEMSMEMTCLTSWCTSRQAPFNYTMPTVTPSCGDAFRLAHASEALIRSE